MTTPDGLTAESMVLLTIISERLGTLGTSNAGYHVERVLEDVRASLPHIEAAAVARHVRETGCDGLREALDRLAWCAVRYGLGRHTYVTAHIAESVARVKDSLREDTRRIIVTDIDRAEERGPDGLGDSVDAGVWRGLRAALASPATEEVER